jgi:hypothetical protein
VQGAERLVIYGARETIKRCLPVVNYEDAAHLGFGDEWFAKYAAGVPDMPEEVRSFNGPKYLMGLGYSLGKAVDIDLFWYPPGYQEQQ